MKTQAIDGVFSRKSPIYEDIRGRFSETFRKTSYPNFVPVQDNYSYSQKGALRGLHYVTGNGQNQVLTILNGTIIDFTVDLRVGSDTFLHYLETAMSHDGVNQIYIPSYCAHGFLATVCNVILQYKTDTYYDSETDRTIQFFDPEVGIKLNKNTEYLRSEKDRDAKLARDHIFF